MQRHSLALFMLVTVALAQSPLEPGILTALNFSEAVAVFDDDHALTVRDDHAGEERLVTIGVGLKGRVLVVVYCYGTEAIRIISARVADRMELREYESQP
jgi:uncharacterized protein